MAKEAKAKIKRKPKSRTSIWLENDLRAKLDDRAEAAGVSLARVITDTLRKGLAKTAAPKGENDAPAAIFG